MALALRSITVVAGLLTAVACEQETRHEPTAPGNVPSLQAFNPDRTQWSQAAPLPAPVNSAFNEQNSSFSPNALSMYVASNRPGGLGANDIWVVQRDCDECPWKSPATNLGPTINSALGDAGPTIAQDGHTMLYQSARAGGFGGTDIWMSHRDDPNDDFAWEPPVNLGPLVNTADQEQGAEYVTSEQMLYFNRGSVQARAADIWRAPMAPNGNVLGPAERVDELSLPGVNDAAATISADGRELIFWTFLRTEGPGRADLYVSTRQNRTVPWGPPIPISGPVNTSFDEVGPSMSHDGRTLLFWSDRPGGLGGSDLWMSTRTPSGRD